MNSEAFDLLLSSVSESTLSRVLYLHMKTQFTCKDTRMVLPLKMTPTASDYLLHLESNLLKIEGLLAATRGFFPGFDT